MQKEWKYQYLYVYYISLVFTLHCIEHEHYRNLALLVKGFYGKNKKNTSQISICLIRSIGRFTFLWPDCWKKKKYRLGKFSCPADFAFFCAVQTFTYIFLFSSYLNYLTLTGRSTPVTLTSPHLVLTDTWPDSRDSSWMEPQSKVRRHGLKHSTHTTILTSVFRCRTSLKL